MGSIYPKLLIFGYYGRAVTRSGPSSTAEIELADDDGTTFLMDDDGVTYLTDDIT